MDWWIGGRHGLWGAILDIAKARTSDHILPLATRSNSTVPDAIRTAILAIRGYEGAEGIYNFDQNGDGLHGYNLVRNDNGTVVFERHIEFKD